MQVDGPQKLLVGNLGAMEKMLDVIRIKLNLGTYMGIFLKKKYWPMFKDFFFVCVIVKVRMFLLQSVDIFTLVVKTTFFAYDLSNTT